MKIFAERLMGTRGEVKDSLQWKLTCGQRGFFRNFNFAICSLQVWMREVGLGDKKIRTSIYLQHSFNWRNKKARLCTQCGVVWGPEKWCNYSRPVSSFLDLSFRISPVDSVLQPVIALDCGWCCSWKQSWSKSTASHHLVTA